MGKFLESGPFAKQSLSLGPGPSLAIVQLWFLGIIVWVQVLHARSLGTRNAKLSEMSCITPHHRNGAGVQPILYRRKHYKLIVVREKVPQFNGQ